MTIEVSIHSGGSNNDDLISREPKVHKIDDDFFEGFVLLTAHRHGGVRREAVGTGIERNSWDAAMEDAKQLVISIDPDQYV